MTLKRYEIGCHYQSVFRNRKSHTGFRLVPTSVTLNGVVALILRYVIEFDSFVCRLRHWLKIELYSVRKI